MELPETLGRYADGVDYGSISYKIEYKCQRSAKGAAAIGRASINRR